MQNVKRKMQKIKLQITSTKLQAPNTEFLRSKNKGEGEYEVFIAYRQYLISNDQNPKRLEFRILDLEFVCDL